MLLPLKQSKFLSYGNAIGSNFRPLLLLFLSVIENVYISSIFLQVLRVLVSVPCLQVVWFVYLLFFRVKVI